VFVLGRFFFSGLISAIKPSRVRKNILWLALAYFAATAVERKNVFLSLAHLVKHKEYDLNVHYATILILLSKTRLGVHEQT